MATPLFQDRRDAGRALAKRLSAHADQPGLRVLALPRGGVPVAFEVARALRAPLDVFVVRKLGVPGQEELAMGAIAPGAGYLNRALVRELGIEAAALHDTIERERVELARRERLYREGLPPLDLRGACVVLVDDGLATGASLRAALRALRALAPARRVAAVPVAAAGSWAEMRGEADECVCVATPQPFVAVGAWYRDFTQVSDEEVRELLAQARAGA